MIRSDLALSLSTGWAYPVVEALDDRLKATLWEIVEDERERQRQRAQS